MNQELITMCKDQAISWMIYIIFFAWDTVILKLSPHRFSQYHVQHHTFLHENNHHRVGICNCYFIIGLEIRYAALITLVCMQFPLDMRSLWGARECALLLSRAVLLHALTWKSEEHANVL